MKIKIKVSTHSKRQQISVQPDGSLKIKLKSLPVKGKANEELIELLAGYYKIFRNQITIVKGLASGDKVAEIIK